MELIIDFEKILLVGGSRTKRNVPIIISSYIMVLF